MHSTDDEDDGSYDEKCEGSEHQCHAEQAFDDGSDNANNKK